MKWIFDERICNNVIYLSIYRYMRILFRHEMKRVLVMSGVLAVGHVWYWCSNVLRGDVNLCQLCVGLSRLII